MWYLLGFIAAATVIFFAGKKISFYGDRLAELTGISKGWIGIILMASITSLPELMVGVSSVGIVGSADLAVGDVIGSCAFNLSILAMLDAISPKRIPIFGLASQTHILNAGLGIILMSVVGLAIFIPHQVAITPWIALSSIIFIFIYFISIRIIYYNERNHANNHPIKGNISDQPGIKVVLVKFVTFSLIIILAAFALPFFAEHIAINSGLKRSFIGTFFLAISTSLPEVAVSIAAVRMGSIDLAVGNLLGSNLFNILILAIDDLFYTKGLLLQDASPVHLVSIFSIILMSAVAVIGLSYHATGKKYFLAWDALVIVLIYIINLFLLFQLNL